jgi:protein-S-isoprenylcysteine O-methyltransferase Ste14
VTWHTFSSLLVGACWSAVGLVWIVGAIYNEERGPRVRVRSRPSYSWLIAIAAFLLISGRTGGWGWLSVSSTWTRAPGAVLLGVATAFTLWARFALGTMWSASVVAKTGHELRTTGPYGITRHPIYTGLAGMLLGTALIDGLGRWVPLFVLVVAFIVVKVRAEERLLSGLFPEYERYRRRVPRLIPIPAHLLRR